jgi:PPOX class probable F420-dependent enzyme
MPDGQPQVHPVWCDFDGDYVRVNTAKSRQKDKNLVREPHATLLLVDPEDPYFWMEIRGEVAERIEGKAAEAHIDDLSHKYTGRQEYQRRSEDEVRVMYKIEPTRIVVSGNGN